MDRRIFFKNMVFSAAGCYLLPGALKGSTIVQALPGGFDPFFSTPPAEYRPWVLWYWMNGHIAKEGITLDLEMLQRNGFRGAFIYHFNWGVPPGPVKTGSNSWLDAVEHAVREAERLGLELFLQFPDGLAGDGAIVPAGERPRHLVWSEMTVSAGRKTRIKMPRPEPSCENYSDFRLFAFPEESGTLLPESVSDITSLMNKNGVISWTPPATGNWTLVRTGSGTFDDGRVIDLMNPSSFRILLENLSVNLLPRVTGKGFRGFYSFINILNQRFWSREDETYFSAREPIEMRPLLLNLIQKRVGNPDLVERFWLDYTQFRQQTVENRFNLEAAEWCKQHGWAWSWLPGSPKGSPAVKNDNLSPGMENSQSRGTPSFTTVLNAQDQSADSPAALRELADQLILSGGDDLMISPFTHQPYSTGQPGMSPGFPGWGAGRFNFWAEHISGLTGYLARNSYLLRKGKITADYIRFTGDGLEENHSKDLAHWSGSYPFACLEGWTLASCSVENGVFLFPGGSSMPIFQLVGGTYLFPDTLRKLSELTEAGVTLLVSGKPAVRLRLKESADEVNQLMEQLFGEWDGHSSVTRNYGKGKIISGKEVNEYLQQQSITPDLTYTSSRPGGCIRYIHRKEENFQLYYISNCSGCREKFNLSFRVGDAQPEIWNPESGEVFMAPLCDLGGGRITLPLEMETGSSLFVLFRKKYTHPLLLKVALDREVIWNTQPLPHQGIFLSPEQQDTPQQEEDFLSPFTFHSDQEGVLKGLFVTNGEYRIEIFNENVGENMTIYIDHCFQVPLDSSWSVRFPPESGAPERWEPERLESLSLHKEDNIRWFSGNCTYETVFYLTESDFTMGRKLLLDLGRVCLSARVFVNGKNAGLAWKFPFVSDITPWVIKGENKLRVEVATSWFNRLAGDEKLPPENLYTQDGFIEKLPDWFVNNQPKPGPRKAFLTTKVVSGDEKPEKSGLFGPVKLIFGVERLL